MVELLERYINELRAELEINEINVGEVQRRLPARRHFWAARLINHKRELFTIKKNRDIREREIAEQLRERSVAKLTISESMVMARGSNEIKSLAEKCYELELLIEFLEKTEKNLSSMVWDIKNIIEIQKMEMM
jgi:hypothetical protein